MIQINLARLRLLAALMGVALIWGWAPPAPAQMSRKLTFEEMVDRSDQVFIARCAEKKTVVKDGMIVTQYKLKPSETWKGKLDLSKDGSLEMEELGGELTKPIPIGQRVAGMADIAVGEETLLFTAKHKPAQAKAGQTIAPSVVSPSSPRIVGRWQGRFTVMRHPASGARLIARAFQSTVPGASIDPRMQQAMIETNPDPAAPAKASQDKTHWIKDPFKSGQEIDQIAKKSKDERDALAKKSPRDAGEVYQFEPLDAVKGRVLKRVNEAQK